MVWVDQASPSCVPNRVTGLYASITSIPRWPLKSHSSWFLSLVPLFIFLVLVVFFFSGTMGLFISNFFIYVYVSV